MSSNTKKLIFLVLALIVGYWAVTTVLHAVASIFFSFLLPVAVVAGVLYAGYHMFGRKALGGGRRTLP